jgi:hypothetical protein
VLFPTAISKHLRGGCNYERKKITKYLHEGKYVAEFVPTLTACEEGRRRAGRQKIHLFVFSKLK